MASSKVDDSIVSSTTSSVAVSTTQPRLITPQTTAEGVKYIATSHMPLHTLKCNAEADQGELTTGKGHNLVDTPTVSATSWFLGKLKFASSDRKATPVDFEERSGASDNQDSTSEATLLKSPSSSSASLLIKSFDVDLIGVKKKTESTKEHEGIDGTETPSESADSLVIGEETIEAVTTNATETDADESSETQTDVNVETVNGNNNESSLRQMSDSFKSLIDNWIPRPINFFANIFADSSPPSSDRLIFSSHCESSRHLVAIRALLRTLLSLRSWQEWLMVRDILTASSGSRNPLHLFTNLQSGESSPQGSLNRRPIPLPPWIVAQSIKLTVEGILHLGVASVILLHERHLILEALSKQETIHQGSLLHKLKFINALVFDSRGLLMTIEANLRIAIDPRFDGLPGEIFEASAISLAVISFVADVHIAEEIILPVARELSDSPHPMAMLFTFLISLPLLSVVRDDDCRESILGHIQRLKEDPTPVVRASAASFLPLLAHTGRQYPSSSHDYQALAVEWAFMLAQDHVLLVRSSCVQILQKLAGALDVEHRNDLKKVVKTIINDSDLLEIPATIPALMYTMSKIVDPSHSNVVLPRHHSATAEAIAAMIQKHPVLQEYIHDSTPSIDYTLPEPILSTIDLGDNRVQRHLLKIRGVSTYFGIPQETNILDGGRYYFSARNENRENNDKMLSKVSDGDHVNEYTTKDRSMTGSERVDSDGHECVEISDFSASTTYVRGTSAQTIVAPSDIEKDAIRRKEKEEKEDWNAEIETIVHRGANRALNRIGCAHALCGPVNPSGCLNGRNSRPFISSDDSSDYTLENHPSTLSNTDDSRGILPRAIVDGRTASGCQEFRRSFLSIISLLFEFEGSFATTLASILCTNKQLPYSIFLFDVEVDDTLAASFDDRNPDVTSQTERARTMSISPVSDNSGASSLWGLLGRSSLTMKSPSLRSLLPHACFVQNALGTSSRDVVQSMSRTTDSILNSLLSWNTPSHVYPHLMQAASHLVVAQLAHEELASHRLALSDEQGAIPHQLMRSVFRVFRRRLFDQCVVTPADFQSVSVEENSTSNHSEEDETTTISDHDDSTTLTSWASTILSSRLWRSLADPIRVSLTIPSEPSPDALMTRSRSLPRMTSLGPMGSDTTTRKGTNSMEVADVAIPSMTLKRIKSNSYKGTMELNRLAAFLEEYSTLSVYQNGRPDDGIRVETNRKDLPMKIAAFQSAFETLLGVGDVTQLVPKSAHYPLIQALKEAKRALNSLPPTRPSLLRQSSLASSSSALTSFTAPIHLPSSHAQTLRYLGLLLWRRILARWALILTRIIKPATPYACSSISDTPPRPEVVSEPGFAFTSATERAEQAIASDLNNWHTLLSSPSIRKVSQNYGVNLTSTSPSKSQTITDRSPQTPSTTSTMISRDPVSSEAPEGSSELHSSPPITVHVSLLLQLLFRWFRDGMTLNGAALGEYWQMSRREGAFASRAFGGTRHNHIEEWDLLGTTLATHVMLGGCREGISQLLSYLFVAYDRHSPPDEHDWRQRKYRAALLAGFLRTISMAPPSLASIRSLGDPFRSARDATDRKTSHPRVVARERLREKYPLVWVIEASQFELTDVILRLATDPVADIRKYTFDNVLLPYCRLLMQVDSGFARDKRHGGLTLVDLQDSCGVQMQLLHIIRTQFKTAPVHNRRYKIYCELLHAFNVDTLANRFSDDIALQTTVIPSSKERNRPPSDIYLTSSTTTTTSNGLIAKSGLDLWVHIMAASYTVSDDEVTTTHALPPTPGRVARTEVTKTRI